jgi:hypothetical protein
MVSPGTAGLACVTGVPRGWRSTGVAEVGQDQEEVVVVALVRSASKRDSVACRSRDFGAQLKPVECRTGTATTSSSDSH